MWAAKWTLILVTVGSLLVGFIGPWWCGLTLFFAGGVGFLGGYTAGVLETLANDAAEAEQAKK